MKILICLLISFSCLAQDRYIKENDIENAHIKKGAVLYDTLEKGQGGAFRFILTDFGKVDTTKIVIIKYEAYQIDVANAEPPPVQIDTIDSEQLVYEGWARHGATSTPGWYKGTISYSTAGTASHKFNGKRIEIWGERGATGSAAVVIDGQSHTVSWNGQFGLPVMIFAKDIPAGDHEIKIAPKGDGNVLIDFLLVHR